MANANINWDEELKNLGISKDVLDLIISLAPLSQAATGYPQDKIESYLIINNW